MNQKKIFIVLILEIISLNIFSQVINIENFRLKTDTTGWFGNCGLSFKMVKNTKNVFDIGTAFHLEHKSKKDLWLFINKVNFVKAGNEDFINNGFQHIRYNFKIIERLTWEAFTQGQYNQQLKIKDRFLFGTGIRYKLLPSEKYKIYYGIAYMYEYEELIKPIIINRNHRASSYLSFTLIFNKYLALVSTNYFQPLLIDFNDYRYSCDNTLQIDITKKFNFKTGFDLIYDAQPPIDVPKTVFNYSSSLGFKF